MRVGLQVYTVRNHLKENPAKTLEQVVTAGQQKLRNGMKVIPVIR